LIAPWLDFAQHPDLSCRDWHSCGPYNKIISKFPDPDRVQAPNPQSSRTNTLHPISGEIEGDLKVTAELKTLITERRAIA
jgi:hypothetical protein